MAATKVMRTVSEGDSFTERPAMPRALSAACLRLHVPAATLLLIGFACFLGPVVFPIPAPIGGAVLDAGLPVFSPGHPFGTDLNGNDVLSRLMHGGRTSLAIAISVNLLGVLVGGTLGALAGYMGGLVDEVVARVLDVLIAFPSLVLVLAIAQGLGPSQASTIAALAFFSVPAFARIARGAALRLRERPFMTAARLCGTGHLRMLALHVVPNILPQVTAFALLGLGIAIVIEGALGFLGLGVPPPAPTWGNMIAHGQHALLTNPALALLPSALLFTTVLCCNLLGDELRARWNAR